jgi:hypothetical protein
MTSVEAWSIFLAILGLIGTIYGIWDGRQQRTKTQRAIGVLREFAKGTETFLLGLKPSIPLSTHPAVDDHIGRAKQTLKAIDAF